MILSLFLRVVKSETTLKVYHISSNKQAHFTLLLFSNNGTSVGSNKTNIMVNFTLFRVCDLYRYSGTGT
jgi:hypothetical protein